jgi:4-hydroxy-3-methylbut-2-enyl diphosphate reductase
MGQAPGRIELISSAEQARELEISGPVYLFAQTTASEDIYKEVAEIITRKAMLNGLDSSDVVVTNSICRQMSQRAPVIREFAAKHDVVIFVSGSASSNGKYLSGIAKEVNPHTYVVSGVNEIGDWFKDAASVGISGATSTPQWLMQAVAIHIENLFTK